MKVKKYRVSLMTEEFGCPWCGCPVYVGDYAYRVVGGDYYCSEACGILGDHTKDLNPRPINEITKKEET